MLDTSHRDQLSGPGGAPRHHVEPPGRAAAGVVARGCRLHDVKLAQAEQVLVVGLVPTDKQGRQIGERLPSMQVSQSRTARTSPKRPAVQLPSRTSA